jgi:Ubiquitin-2 like Rad60 SUMO-like
MKCSHITQDSAAYEAFCWSINNGMLIHHNLLGMLDSAEEKQQRYAETYKMYELAFPPSPVAKVWPAPAVASTTSAPATPTTAAAPAPAVVSLEPVAGATAADANAGSSRNFSRKRSAAEALQGGAAGSSGGSVSSCVAEHDARADAQEAAPSAEEDKDLRITISVRACNGEAMFFRVKPHARMSKVFTAYAANTEVQVTSLAFYLDGTRINGEGTVQELELKEDDTIDAVLEREGC